MEQPNEQPIESIQSSKNISITVIAVVATALIVGGGVYAWQRSNLKNTEQGLQQQISVLQNQISQLQQQTNQTQKSTVNNQVKNTLEEKYLRIWQNILINENSLSDEYFNDHIVIQDYSINKWNTGESLRVNYQLIIDWATIDVHDSILIKVSKDDTFSNLVTPEIYLEEADIKALIERETSKSTITQINQLKSLKYSNYNEAVESFKTSSGYNDILPDGISLRVPGKVPREDGNPYFVLLSGVINEKDNRCLKGHFNLVTGQGNFYEDVCIIFN